MSLKPIQAHATNHFTKVHLPAYQLTRKYADRYDQRYGTGLLPKSAPMVEEIAEFWGRYYLGRGWKKNVGA